MSTYLLNWFWYIADHTLKLWDVGCRKYPQLTCKYLSTAVHNVAYTHTELSNFNERSECIPARMPQNNITIN